MSLICLKWSMSKKASGQRPLVPPAAAELAFQLFFEFALVEDPGEAVAHHQLVDRLVVGGLGILFVQELEVHRADLEAVARAQPAAAVHLLVVHVGAVGALEVFDQHHVAQMPEPRMQPRQRPHVRHADARVGRPPDLQLRPRRQAVAPARASGSPDARKGSDAPRSPASAPAAPRAARRCRPRRKSVRAWRTDPRWYHLQEDSSDSLEARPEGAKRHPRRASPSGMVAKPGQQGTRRLASCHSAICDNRDMTPRELQALLDGADIYLLDQILRGRITAGMSIFDAGCGGGRNLVDFLRAGFEVAGVDSQPAAIAAVRELAEELAPALPEASFRCEPLEAHSFADASFDVVLSSAVLHFARDEEQFNTLLAGSWRPPRPGGLFFCRLASTIGMAERREPLGGRRSSVAGRQPAFPGRPGAAARARRAPRRRARRPAQDDRGAGPAGDDHLVLRKR